MSSFTPEQLQELEERFNLRPKTKVRDGFISRGDFVWWRGECGPEHVSSSNGSHWGNMLEYPNVYQIAKPVWVPEEVVPAHYKD